MNDNTRSDGVSDTRGGGESQGGPWPGKQDAPAHPDKGVVTHVVRETEHAVNRGKDDKPG
ncbi:hypothetical protein [Sphingomonas quercus]|uniref:Uncharacterized protein n=1 Tax=Sphingomonas quercus TaxID=2842451 RepID=A0ABS6BM85_9SPHN|nr:hypothetical protein [Sphingomonas quercus]MBU3079413.1 hypothetical protein [Sphingomonas quercus]